MAGAAHEIRPARVLESRWRKIAARQWQQSGEAKRGRELIVEVSHSVGLWFGVGRRHASGDTVVVEWSTGFRRWAGVSKRRVSRHERQPVPVTGDTA
jgi:hypothetical protein